MRGTPDGIGHPVNKGLLMKDIPNHLRPFLNYAKIFLKKIHPDAHHGYPVVQKVNAPIISTINELFKFQNETAEAGHSFHNLNFFVRTEDKLTHKEVCYKLLCNVPFDRASGKSALGLFKSADVSVDFSVIDLFPAENNIASKNRNEGNSSKLFEAVKNHCLDLSNIPSFDLNDARAFLQSRPYIQFEGPLPEDKSIVIKLIAYLSHILNRNESKIDMKMPLILISDRFSYPEYSGNIMHLPLYSNFEGTWSKRKYLSRIHYLFLELKAIFKIALKPKSPI